MKVMIILLSAISSLLAPVSVLKVAISPKKMIKIWTNEKLRF
jgi:hypothetical protein